jgi:transporter family-2 protein
MLPYIAVAAAAGIFLPLQALINAKAGAALFGPLSAAFLNFAVGLVALVLLLLVIRFPWPTQTQLAQLPVWAYAGGLFGAFFVVASTLAIPKLGAAPMVAIIIAGQLISSMVLDHYGVLHAAQPITLAKAAGGALLLLGAYLMLLPSA